MRGNMSWVAAYAAMTLELGEGRTKHFDETHALYPLHFVIPAKAGTHARSSFGTVTRHPTIVIPRLIRGAHPSAGRGVKLMAPRPPHVALETRKKHG